MPRKVYRSVLAVRRDAEQKLAPQGCEHTVRYHSTPEAAHTCLAARVRDALSRPLIELVAKVEHSHSRHDWFPL